MSPELKNVVRIILYAFGIPLALTVAVVLMMTWQSYHPHDGYAEHQADMMRKVTEEEEAKQAETDVKSEASREAARDIYNRKCFRFFGITACY